MKKLTLTIPFILFICFANLGQKLPFQGYLEESGLAVNGTRTFDFELTDYGWTETIASVTIDNGIYNVVLGENTPLPDSLFVGSSECPLTITIDGTEIGQVMLYKPLINGKSLLGNEENVVVKGSNGKVKADLNYFANNDSGSLVLNGANDSTKVILGSISGGYGGFLGLYDSLRNLGAQLRVTNKGRGNLYTYNENNQNVGWFGGTANDGFAQIIAYDATENVSGAALIGSFVDGIYPEYYLEGTAQSNFGLARLKVSQLGNSTEETAALEINRSNGGGQALLTINQDDGGSDPSGSAAGLDLFGDSSPNFQLGSASWEDHDLANMSLYGAIPDGGGWYFSAANFNVSKTPGGQEYGFISLNNNIVGTSTETTILTGNFNETGAGGIEVRDSLGATTITLDGNNSNISSNRASDGGSAINLFQNAENGGISIQNATNNNTLFYEAGTNVFELKINDTTSISLDGNTGAAIFDGSVTQASDKRLKKEIQPLENALKNTLQLRGTSYYWKDKHKSSKKQIGVIAQELEEIYPELVHTNDQGFKSVNYSQLTAVLIEAIKQLNGKVESLEKENTELSAALQDTKQLSERISKLEKLLLKEAKVASN